MSRLSKRASLAYAGAALSALVLSAGLHAQSAPERANSFSGTLSPLNGTGVTGTFTIEQRGQGQITVMIQATGLEKSDNPHVAHIHGLEGNVKGMCPTIAQDQAGDNDGFVELLEGLPVYGPIVVPLGDVDPNNDGVVNYSKTFNLNESATFASGKGKGDLFPIEFREIVLHGLTLEEGDGANGGEADGTAGYKTVLPVACGAIEMNDRRSKGPKTITF
jgi:hypothetical protein